MAKQVGPLFFTGTIDGLIFYKLGDKYYTRSKGAYKSAKHMRRNPKYKRTMQQADRFGGAAQLVKEVYYRHLPKAIRKHGLFGQLTGLVNRWLYQGKSVDEVKELLSAHCQHLAATAIPAKQTEGKPAVYSSQPTRPKNRTTINLQPTTNVEQRPTVSAQRPKDTEHRSTNTAQRSTKNPRYLSRWKVKRNGRLHIKGEGKQLPTYEPALPVVPVFSPCCTRTLTNIEPLQLE